MSGLHGGTVIALVGGGVQPQGGASNLSSGLPLCLCVCSPLSLPLIDMLSVCVAGSLWTGWRCPGQTFASAATEWLNTRETNTTSPTHRGTASLSELVPRLYIGIDPTAYAPQLHTLHASKLFHICLRELGICGAANGRLSITCPDN